MSCIFVTKSVLNFMNVNENLILSVTDNINTTEKVN